MITLSVMNRSQIVICSGIFVAMLAHGATAQIPMPAPEVSITESEENDSDRSPDVSVPSQTFEGLAATVVGDRLTELSNRVSRAEQKAEHADEAAEKSTQFVWKLGLVGAVAGLLYGFAIAVKLRSKLTTAEKKLEKQIQDRFESRFDEEWGQLASKLAQQAESDLLRFTEFLSLAHTKQHEEALACFGVDDSELLKELDSHNPAIRRAVIECLAPSKYFLPERLELAWIAISRLFEVDKSAQTLALFLKVAVRTQEYQRGLKAYFDDDLGAILDDEDCDVWAATLLRRLNKPGEALAVVEKYSSFEDCISTNTVASLHRDQGDFTTAYDLLRAQVVQILKRPPRPLPLGWEYVINSFVANCADRGKPSEATDCVLFLIANNNHPKATFNCLNWCVQLPGGSSELKQVVSKLENSVSFLESDTNGERCRSLLKESMGDIDSAISVLEPMTRAGQPANGSSRLSQNDYYFLVCHLARLYIAKARFGHAITLLIPRIADDNASAEAEYLLGKAYMLDSQEPDGVSWLSQAFSRRKYWVSIARLDDDIGNTQSVIELIAGAQQNSKATSEVNIKGENESVVQTR